jgi:hypothetical protein
MPLNTKTKQQMKQLLQRVDEHGTRGHRLVDAGERLWKRIGRFISMDLAAEPDTEALELACYALQLPMAQEKPPGAGKLGRTNLRERCEQSAEMLVSLMEKHAEEDLLDRAGRLLLETPHRSPVLEDAKLLADALNLEDFGVTGLVEQIIQLARQGDGLHQFLEGCEKRDAYGYWEARLKEGFHFEPVRQIARRRLIKARECVETLKREASEDQAIDA